VKLGAYQKIRRTTMLCVACAMILVGIFVVQLGVTTQSPTIVAGIFATLALLFRRRALLLLLFVPTASFFIGIQRGATVWQNVQEYQQLYGQEVALSGVIVDDVAVQPERRQQEFHLGKVAHNNRSLAGRVQVRTYDEKKLLRGDWVVVKGKLGVSKGTTRQGTLKSAVIVWHKSTESSLEHFRVRFFAAVKSILPEPHASLGLGYLVGLRVSLPEEVNEQLATVGLTHIIAVSGYNLTILVQAARKLRAGKSAFQAVIFAGVLLAVFMLIAGGSASINRAAVVCVLGLVAWYYGRDFKPLLLLLLSGVITGMYNPLYVWGDPGWYLSFLAFAGILLLAPLVERRYFKEKTPRLGVQILLETLCAQVFTIPYTMYLFGGVSVIAPLANVLVLPFIPFIMVGVATAGLVALVSPTIGSFIALPSQALLSLQLWVIEKVSAATGAYQEVTITSFMMAGMFIGLLAYMYMLRRRIGMEKSAQMDYTNSSSLLPSSKDVKQ
jgi:competence protein ComEC